MKKIEQRQINCEKLAIGFHTIVAAALLSVFTATAADKQPKTQTIELLQAELQSIVNGPKRWGYKDLEKSGWKPPEFGSSEQPWPHSYLVLRKANVYGVVVTQGKKTDKVSNYGVPYYDYRDGTDIAYVIADIPAGYFPVVGCVKITDWEDAGRRCKASKGENCSINKPAIEMLAFAKMPSKCAQRSTLLHSAYRYSEENPTQLQSVPIEGMNCGVEDYRAKQCPVLMQ